MNKVITHGELRLKKVDKLPDSCTVETLDKKYVASHSESGHNHVIESKSMKIATMGTGERYLLIEELAKLVHAKDHDAHATRTLEPGIYEIGEKTEYNPFTKTIERVFD